MSTGVFGNPVTNETVQMVAIGVTNITQRHRAEVALLYMNDSEGKKVENTIRHVSNLSRNYGGHPVTMCSIYNATGNNLTYVGSHNWDGGSVWGAHYPNTIQNGQWAAFLHVRGRPMGPSKGAVVYRGTDHVYGTAREWVLAWETGNGVGDQNRVYNEIRLNSNTIDWNNVESAMGRNQLNQVIPDQFNCFSSVAIGGYSLSPNFTAILTTNMAINGPIITSGILPDHAVAVDAADAANAD